jgi:hypothetical protein
MKALAIIAVLILVASGGFVYLGFQPAEVHGEVSYSVDIRKSGTQTVFSLNLENADADYEMIVDATNFDVWFAPQYIIDEPNGDPVYNIWIYLNDQSGVRVTEMDKIITLPVKNQLAGTSFNVTGTFSFADSHPPGDYNLFVVLRYKPLPSSFGYTTLDTEMLTVAVTW